jgi:Predicted nucleotide kinase (related to CMP and AMP kinases)
MNVITGTPGTGKTSVAKELENRGYSADHLNRVLDQQGIGEPGDERKVEVKEMRRELETDADVLEGHLAHFLPADVCVVLRCDPDVLRTRLSVREYPDSKIRENLIAEAIDTVLQQAVETQETVVEINTTELSISEVADVVEQSFGDRESNYGDIDFSGFLTHV